MIVDGSALRFDQLPGRRSADPFAGSGVTGLSMRVVRLRGGAPRSPHRHPHSFEVMYVVSGSGHLWEDGRFQRVRPGDCVAIRPGVAHATVPDDDTDMELVCFFPRDAAGNIEELDEPEDLGVLRKGRAQRSEAPSGGGPTGGEEGDG